MKVVILCGGKGTRLREETEYRPKPLVLIGNKPILWHIMKIYSHYGYNDFILCLGYKGEMIKDYFLRSSEMANDFTLRYNLVGQESICHHQNNLENWNITFVDTGKETNTGGRVARIKKYIGDDKDFFLTYGDGVANININTLYNFHRLKDRVVTLTAVKPMSYYGVIEIKDGLVNSFQEKPELEKPISGGFFVCDRKVFDSLSPDEGCVFEISALKQLSKDGQLAAYEHNNFWFAMDTYKQQERLNQMWKSNLAPWKIWSGDNLANNDEKISHLGRKEDLFLAPTRFDLPSVAVAKLPIISEQIKPQNQDSHYWQSKKVFITGCTGLLGSWMVKYLVERGADVVGLVRDFVPNSNLHKSNYFSKINVVKGRLEDRQILERALGEYEIDTVFHLAAQTIVGIANRNPISTFESNIRGTYNLLESCRRSPLVKRIVVASSDKAYGDQNELPYYENAPLQGRHPYDVSKSCVDLLSQAYYKTYNLPVCITRCGNFFGGGDLNFNRIVPGTIRSVLQNESPIIRSDGSLIRDYFYIEDGVEAYLLLAEKMDDLAIYGQAFNFSNENQIAVLEITQRIVDLMNSSAEIKILGEASNEINHQYLSAQKAKEILNWRPKYSLDKALLKTIDWYKNFLFKGKKEK